MSFTHNLDQMSAMLRDIAPLMYSYYKYLLDAGFTEIQAFMLVLEYQKYIFQGRGDNDVPRGDK